MSLCDTHKVKNAEAKRNDFLKKVKTDFEQYGEHKMKKVKSNNIMIIGRTRSGKTTIKSLLQDPTKVSDEMTLKSDTKDAFIESFYIDDRNATLNIIDTPGLFERGSDNDVVRENKLILETIEKCANIEITSFNVICFCVAITVGINSEDVESIRLFMKALGDEISSNSCLIVTHCEAKKEEQHNMMRKELEEDKFFKEIKSYFKLGIFFSGAINRDNYNNGNECIIDEYVAICKYRTKLIDLFTSNLNPFPITETKISEIRRANQTATAALNKLESAENLTRQYAYTNTDLQSRCSQQEARINDFQKKCKINEQTIDHAEKKSRENERTINDLREQCKEYKRIIDELRTRCAEEKRYTELFQSRIAECEKIIEELLRSVDQWKVRQLKEKYPNYFSRK